MAEDSRVMVTLRPEVPMGAYHGLGYVCVLGAVRALSAAGCDAGIGWPFDIVDTASGEVLARVRVQAGYDEGMFATCEVALPGHLDDAAQAVAAGIEAEVAAWAEQVRAGRAKAGPLAPVLSDYFDLMPLLGQRVEAVYPNGNVMARGTFAGIDIWGRATLHTDAGQELESAPEQASIRPCV